MRKARGDLRGGRRGGPPQCRWEGTEGAKHVGAVGSTSQGQGTACRGLSCASPPGDTGQPPPGLCGPSPTTSYLGDLGRVP